MSKHKKKKFTEDELRSLEEHYIDEIQKLNIKIKEAEGSFKTIFGLYLQKDRFQKDLDSLREIRDTSNDVTPRLRSFTK